MGMDKNMQIASIRKNNGKFDVVFPDNFVVPGEKMYIKKIGNSILLIPVNDPWNNFYDSLDLFTEDFMQKRDQPIPETREAI
jgi:antitoxin VapB